jgi:hypothetical protein
MDKIASLGATEHAEIFRILKKHGVSHTQNKNGVFINITSLEDAIIKEVTDFVLYCSHNNKELEEYDKRLNQCKLYQNLDCMAPKSKEEDDDEGVKEEDVPLTTATSSMQRYFESLENSMDMTRRRQHLAGNNKYTTARKKYSKRIMGDGKKTITPLEGIEGDELLPESYIGYPDV